MATGFELLAAGNFFGSFFQPYIDIGISQSFVMLIIFMMGMALCYEKQRKVEMIGFSALMFSPVILESVFEQIPIVGRYLTVLIIVGFAFLVYKLMKD